MSLLLSGLALFVVVHLLPSMLPGRVDAARRRLGSGAVKGLIGVAVLGGMVLIVVGWRSALPQGIYAPIPALRLPALLLIVVAIWLFAVASRPSVVKQVLRHPQLTGLLLWSIAHLLLNGDSRSLALFGTLAIWSVLEMLLINRRDGAYVAPPAPAMKTDIATAGIAVVVFLVLVIAHPWLAGVPVAPMS